MPGLRSATDAVHTLRFGRTWARLGPWAADRDIVRLVVSPDADLDGPAVDACLARARSLGYRAVVTNALDAREAAPFLARGFSVRERLHLLVASLDDWPPAAPSGESVRIDRVRRREEAAVLDLDAAAFGHDWRLGPVGLRDALDATPQRQFRATRTDDDSITGYAITGLAGATGYLQRIATDPRCRRQGLGRALVLDGFSYLWRRGASRVFVNTQADNVAALTLYESCGFERLPDGLAVLERAL